MVELNVLRFQLRRIVLRCRKIAAIACSRPYRRALRSGVAAGIEHHSVPFLPSFNTVIDVGASRGQFALFAATRWPEAKILCFEPLPLPRQKLQEVLGGRVEVFDVALGSAKGSSVMQVSGRDDSSSMLTMAAQLTEYPETATVDQTEVEVACLAEYLADGEALPGTILLKIDVQGFELEVLRGCADALALVDQVYCECSFQELYAGQPMAGEVVSFLQASDFELAGVYGTVRGRDGRQIQADLLFNRRSLLPAGGRT